MTEKKETKKEAVPVKETKKTESKFVDKKVSKDKAETKKKDIKKSENFAVIATGGKQIVVREGDFLNIEKLSGEYKNGVKIEFDEVLLTDNGKETKVGEPTISGTKVVAEFVENGRDKKISVIRFRSKSRYFKNKGHRQPYTRVKIIKV